MLKFQPEQELGVVGGLIAAVHPARQAGGNDAWWIVDGGWQPQAREATNHASPELAQNLSALGLASPDSKATSGGGVMAFGWSGTGWYTAVQSSDSTTVRERKAERSYL